MLKYFFIFLFFYLSIVAQTWVTIPDTTLIQGQKAYLPISTNFIPNTDSLNFSIILSFDPSKINIDSAFGSNNFIVKSDTFKTNITFIKSDSALIEFNFLKFNQISSDTLCFIRIEALASNDSISFINTLSLKLDNISIPFQELNVAKINVIGSGINYEPIEIIYQNSPNPFDNQTTFKLKVDNIDNANIQILSLIGSTTYNLSDNEINIQKSDDGLFLINFTPNSYSSSGFYLLQVKTSKGIYYKPFFFLK